jgi:membrane-associated phospholipid phosphatase
MKLPLIQSHNKGKYIFIGYFLFCLIYCVAPHINLFPLQQIAATPLDKAIPFVPVTIWIYNSQFAFLFLALWMGSDATRKTLTYYAMLIATAIAFIFFVFLPTEIPHQVVHSEGLTGRLWRVLYLADTSQNCFPSLHVALAILAANALMIVNQTWRVAAPLWATLICISTLTTKQHHMIDILGGIGVAMASWFIINYLVITEYAYESPHQ